MSRDLGCTKIGMSSKLVDLVISAVFMGYITLFLGPGAILMSRDPGHTKIGTSSKLVDLVISVRFIAHCFWVRERFRCLVTPDTRKLGRRQNSSIWSFLAIFAGYSTPFLGPWAISMSRDPGCTKIGRSSKLIDLVISGRFHGL